jgi:hypothetical protein
MKKMKKLVFVLITFSISESIDFKWEIKSLNGYQQCKKNAAGYSPQHQTRVFTGLFK